MYKGYFQRGGCFVAVKKINCFERVRCCLLGKLTHSPQRPSLAATHSNQSACARAQDKRHQMMNDVKALCEVDDAGLVRFVGAYHAPENGQVRSLQRMRYGLLTCL